MRNKADEFSRAYQAQENWEKFERLSRELERLETERWFLSRQLERIEQDIASHRRIVRDQAMVAAGLCSTTAQ